VSTRRYVVALEPVGQAVETEATSTSKSTVSRKFVAMTEHALADLLAADLSRVGVIPGNLCYHLRGRDHRKWILCGTG